MQQAPGHAQPALKASHSPFKSVQEKTPRSQAAAQTFKNSTHQLNEGAQDGLVDASEVYLPGGDHVKQALQSKAEAPLNTRLHAALGPTGFISPADIQFPEGSPDGPVATTMDSERDDRLDESTAQELPHAASAPAKDLDRVDDADQDTAQDLEQQALLAVHEPGVNSFSNGSDGRAGAARPTKHRWHRDRQVQLTLAGYASVCFVYILFDEMVPMYSSAPHQAGGLGLQPSQLALPMMASGPIMFVWSIWGYPILETWLGGVTPAMRWNLVAATMLTPLVPIASAFVPLRTPAVQLCLAVTLSFCRMIGNNMFSCASGLINLAAPKAQLGRVNAVGSLLSAGVRSVGPALGGFVWGSSVTIPAHQYAVFSAMSLGLLSILLIYAGVKV